MSTYFIGDIHGCYKYLQIILDRVHFNPTIDTLHSTGDLVSRGPDSLKVLRLMYTYKKNTSVVLGNHDFHLLKTYLGIHQQQFNDHFNDILNAPDIDNLMNWLRHQPMLYINENKKILMTHAGIHPYWNLHSLKKNAKEIEKFLTDKNYSTLFQHTFDTTNHTENKNYNKLKKIKKNIDIFTKMRYIYLDGQLNMTYKSMSQNVPNNIFPWFNIPNVITQKEYSIIFGHWASLKKNTIPSDIYGLDSGCCWGGKLTLLRWEDKKIIQVSCS